MILPDWEIQQYGEDLISPFKLANLQPASMDLTLDTFFIKPKAINITIDLGDIHGTIDKARDYIRQEATQDYALPPQAFVLGATAETVKVSADLVGRVEGKSSLGRLGLLVHSTAGFIDPGFEGKITLEFYNLGPRSILLRPGLRICQISFSRLSHACQRPYGSVGLGSKYQGQSKTTESRYQG